jgi:hypothetical protein
MVSGVIGTPMPGDAESQRRITHTVHGAHPRVQEFVHPGILQSRADLEFMKKKILARENPWFDKWTELLALPISSLSFEPRPVTHIVRGSYGRMKVGDEELHQSIDAANSHVLQWYVGRDAKHAEKTADILDAWARTLWDFDGNDAKLIAGWTGASLCEAAEILRATYPKWGSDRELRFRKLITGVYLPLERDFFPEANGNWDGAIMQTVAAIAIFTDDRQLFDKVVDHYRTGEGNGGITKYVYPNGQCEESTRDMGHTQLGLGYFALTAHVCWNQGVDLFSLADNRLALGFEYTSKYMLGETVPYYGDISTKGRGHFSDFYEVAYQHYRYIQGRSMPYTEKALLRAREHAKSTLTMYQGESSTASHKLLPAPVVSLNPLPGALTMVTPQPPIGATVLAAGVSIQAALDALGNRGGGILFLQEGFHNADQPLRLPSKVTLAGTGRGTILSLAAEASGYCIVAGAPDLHDVVLRDFIIEGSTTHQPPSDPNQDRRLRSTFQAPARGGIQFSGERQNSMSEVRMQRLTIRNCTLSAVELEGISDITIDQCDFSDSGGYAVPGPGQHHNLRIHYCRRVAVHESRFDSSIAGCGLSARSVEEIKVDGCEAARNKAAGLRFADCDSVAVTRLLTEGNDGRGLEFLRWGKQTSLKVGQGNISQLNRADSPVCDN